jgi:hypothetical protein
MVGATKFQYETMSNLIHFYKKKCMGLKELVEKLRREVEKLQMINGELLVRRFQESPHGITDIEI